MVIQVTAEDKFKYGVKRTCRSCGINFYDLDRHPSECPNCGAIYELHVTTRAQKYVAGKEEELYDSVPFNLDGVEEDIIDTNIELADDDPFADVVPVDEE